MSEERLCGAWTALVTPFNEDGSIDWESFERNVTFQLEQGITGLVPTGTTGESPALSWEEHNAVIEKTTELARGQAHILAGTGSNSTSEALSASKHAIEGGADGVLLVDCYYNGPSSLELRTQYHGTIARELPEATVVPYIVPGRTGCALAPEDLAILAYECPNVRAVKEATGDLQRMAVTRELCPENFSILSGDDNITYELMTDARARGDGVVSVISNVVPSAVERMVRAVLEGNVDGAGRLNEALSPLFSIVTVSVENTRWVPGKGEVTVKDKFRNPLAIKTLMRALGMIRGGCRKPLGKMTPSGVRVVREAVSEVWRNSPEILEPLGEFYSVDLEARITDDKVWENL